MKKWLSVWLVLSLCALSLSGLAEGAADEGDFFDHARDWWNAFSDSTADLRESASEVFESGKQYAKEALSERIDAAERYMSTHYPDWNERAAKSWETLKQAALYGVAEAKAQAGEAYATLKAWFNDHGDEIMDGLNALLGAMAAAAGLTE